MKNDEVRLVVNGKRFEGWLGVSVKLGLNTFARSFSLTLTRSTRDRKEVFYDVDMKSTIELFIGRDKVLTGYVMSIDESYDASSTVLTVAGYGKGVDLVDSACPIGSKKSFKRAFLTDIISEICGPFGVRCVDEVGKRERIDFNFFTDDRIADVLSKLSARYQLLFSDSAEGDLKIARAGSGGEAERLVFGKTILNLAVRRSASKLFSDWHVIGQGANPASNREDDANSLIETSTFPWRKRVSITSQSGDATREKLKARAVALRDFNVAMSREVIVTVQGWRQKSGRLWDVNCFVFLDAPYVHIQERLLVTEVMFSLGAEGSTTTLKLQSPDAFVDTSCSHIQDVAKNEANVNLGLVGIGDGVAGGEWTEK